MYYQDSTLRNFTSRVKLFLLPKDGSAKDVYLNDNAQNTAYPNHSGPSQRRTYIFNRLCDAEVSIEAVLRRRDFIATIRTKKDSMAPFILRLLACSLIAIPMLSATQGQLPDLPFEIPSNLTENPLTAGDEAKMNELTAKISASEWLGPLAPIAISPFFGITILAGLSQFGGAYFENSFISNNPVLSNPAVFWVFLGLTVLTSLPRFTKVSKPAAQAIDQLEAYAGIITIVLIRLMMTMGTDADPVGSSTAMVVEMGIFTMTADVLLSIAAAINIFVINTVKFFFEVMVWLIPVPFIDAVLEVSNKAACAGLMAIYAWSPTVATILNLLIFIACLFAFRWIYRRVQYMRSVLCDPIWALLSPGYGEPKSKELVVFPQKGFADIPAKSKLLLQPTDSGWQLVQPRWFLPPKVKQLSKEEHQMELQSGMLLNSIELTGNESDKLLFSKRYSKNLSKLAEQINVAESGKEFEVDLRADFAKA